VTRLAVAAHETAVALADARRSGDHERAAALAEELAALAELHALEQARWLADLHPAAPQRRPLPLFGALLERRGSDVSSPLTPKNRRP
jgi:hypothetical protein